MRVLCYYHCMSNINSVEEATELLKKSGFISLLGIEILELAPKSAKGRMMLAAKYCNPYGSMHGGCLYSLADTVCGTLANSKGCEVATADGDLRFLEPAASTRYVYCEALLKKSGRHLITVAAEITDDNGKLLACGTYTFFRMA